MRIDTIYFEGPTCCGKSTMMNEFNKSTDYLYTCIDRGHLSGVVEAQLRGRKNIEEKKRALLAELERTNSLIVLCGYWNYDENRKRWMQRGDDVVTNTGELRAEYNTWSQVLKEMELIGHPLVKRVTGAQNLEVVLEVMNKR